MKKIVLLLFLSTAIQGYSIVFVHLGKKIPTYLFDAAEQAYMFNEQADIFVIAEQQAIDNMVQKCNATFIPCESLITSESHKKFRKETKLNKTARDGLWCKSTERFFYVDELIRQYKLVDVFHLENDNMLYVDLNELMPVFRRYAGIAAIFDADQRCIPGFMYIANMDAVERLVSFIAKEASKAFYDTRILAVFKQGRDSTVIDNLPIVMPEYTQSIGLRDKQGRSTKDPTCYMRYIELFDSIFDGAAIGQYLGGNDSNQHKHAKPGFVNETCLFNASKLQYVWKKDAQGRRVPYASCGGRMYRINNLHIHSKNLKAFAS